MSASESGHRLFQVFEILEQIFEHVSVSDPVKGPMTVSQVSQNWREISLKSSSIWSNVTVRLESLDTSSRHTLALVYFERSRKAPITLTVSATRRFRDEEKMRLLQPHAWRFRSISLQIKLEASTDSESLVNLIWFQLNTGMQMPLLEAFSTVTTIKNTGFSIRRNIDTIDGNIKYIPPVIVTSDGNVVDWALWNPTGLTALFLDTTHILEVDRPDMDEIYHILATTCQTLQCFEYQGYISSINNAGANTRTRLAFPDLHSLAILCHENMVPLLEFLIIPALESLVLRDFKVSPAAATPAIHGSTLLDLDERTDPYGLYQAIQQWSSITHLEIYGVDNLPSDNSSLTPDLRNYVQSLNQLTSLVLYGIGMATSIAKTLFKEKPQALLPKLSHFLLGITEMSSDDHLLNFLLTRQLHDLPRLKKLSINEGYFRHLQAIDLKFKPVGLSNLVYMDVLLDSSHDIFVFADPEAGKFIPMEEENLLERCLYEIIT